MFPVVKVNTVYVKVLLGQPAVMLHFLGAVGVVFVHSVEEGADFWSVSAGGSTSLFIG